MKPILIIKTGTTFSSILNKYGDFEDWIINTMNVPGNLFVITPVFDGASLPGKEEVSGVIITGSHAMVTDSFAWSEKIVEWLPDVVSNDIPVLGICYGHQLLAYAMGGNVGYHPKGREIGSVVIKKTPVADNDRLFGALPREFVAHVAHEQTVLTLPPGAEILASNDFEPHHAYRVNQLAWGVQFHPEFNENILKTYINEQKQQLETEGFKFDLLLSSINNSFTGKILLRKFLDIVDQNTSDC